MEGVHLIQQTDFAPFSPCAEFWSYKNENQSKFSFSSHCWLKELGLPQIIKDYYHYTNLGGNQESRFNIYHYIYVYIC